MLLFLFDETGDFIFSSPMIGAGDFVVDSMASVVLIVVVLTACLFGEFWGKFFFTQLFLVTWIHHSSSFLLGWSSISFIDGAVVFSVAVAIVVVGEVIVAVVVVIVVVVVIF